MQNRLFWKWTEDVDLTLPPNLDQVTNGNGMDVDDEKDNMAIPDAIDLVRVIKAAGA